MTIPKLTKELVSLDTELGTLSAQLDQAEARRDAAALDAAEFAKHNKAASAMKARRDALTIRLEALRSQLVDAEAEARVEHDRKAVVDCDMAITACHQRFEKTHKNREAEIERHRLAIEKFKATDAETRRELDAATKTKRMAMARIPQQEPSPEELEQIARRKACEAQLKIVKRLQWDIEIIERNRYCGKPIDRERKRLTQARKELDRLEKLCPSHRDRRLRDEKIVELKRERSRLGHEITQAMNNGDLKKKSEAQNKIEIVEAELAEA